MLFIFVFLSFPLTVSKNKIHKFSNIHLTKKKKKVLGTTTNLTTDSDYGKTWIYFPDGNSKPQIAYLTKEPNQNSNLRASMQEIMSKVKFQLYRQSSQRKPKYIDFYPSEDLLKHFDLSLDVKMLIHGWKSSSLSPTIEKIKNSYFSIRDFNMLTVNWEELAENIFYLTVASQTKQVGQIVAEFIDELVDRGVNINKIHLIGHSLGAHVCGYAGRFFNGKIRRITGLDPARPSFEIVNILGLQGLGKTDARFVDVIHTSAGFEGYRKAIGHADFYPNDGEPPQPGCEEISNLISKMNFKSFF